MTFPEKLKKELEKAAALKNSALAKVSTAAIIAEALRSVGQDPILVGGAAVEYYTEGGYSTADVDMVSEGGPELIKVMGNLGFHKIGKDFSHPKLKIYVEFPGRALKASEKFSELEIYGHRLRIISIEDLVVDRLCAFKFWKSTIDGVNTLLLLELGEAEPSRVQQRAQEEGVQDALEVLEQCREEVIRKKLSPVQASEILEQKMRGLKASRS